MPKSRRFIREVSPTPSSGSKSLSRPSRFEGGGDGGFQMGAYGSGLSPLGRSGMGRCDGAQTLPAGSSIGGGEMLRRGSEQRGRLLDNLAFRGRQVARDLGMNDESCEIISKIPVKVVEQISEQNEEVEVTSKRRGKEIVETIDVIKDPETRRG
ncbi:hypothetical protein COLO4_18722 [Corchorus olitorius]|uniref:Uncharacterized protein n=1 Tax=Corchorus olitorius TaxID=93759 RepID=A0A1R3J830_9ROSI|nr:hypothetical protein COLO4_18722 [Corchorus olitorius]